MPIVLYECTNTTTYKHHDIKLQCYYKTNDIEPWLSDDTIMWQYHHIIMLQHTNMMQYYNITTIWYQNWCNNIILKAYSDAMVRSYASPHISWNQYVVISSHIRIAWRYNLITVCCSNIKTVHHHTTVAQQRVHSHYTTVVLQRHSMIPR